MTSDEKGNKEHFVVGFKLCFDKHYVLARTEIVDDTNTDSCIKQVASDAEN